jgi:UTP--glucose-1-phosphate uridylyltransferase
MDAPAYVVATLAKAEKAGAHPAEVAALRQRLKQLGEPQAGLLPGEALEPLRDVARLEELPDLGGEQEVRRLAGCRSWWCARWRS